VWNAVPDEESKQKVRKKMTYKEFSELESGSAITIAQFEEIFIDSTSVMVADDSPRGCKAVYKDLVKKGDYVNNSRRFIKIV
jgi:hypothetical protein